MAQGDSGSKSSDYPAVARVVREIKRRVAAGAIAPDTFLAPERELCADLEAARGTLRKALAVLEKDGLVERVFGRGTRVVAALDRLERNVVGVVYRGEVEARNWPEERWQILEGILDALAKRGCRYEVVPAAHGLISSNRGADSHERLSAERLADRYGAIVFNQTFGSEAEIQKLNEWKIPVVVANLEVDLEVSATWVDHRKAARHAVNTLAAFGHRRIALISRDPNILFYGETRKGFEAGLEEAGLSADDTLMIESQGYDALAAYFAASDLMALRPRPTAIVAARDFLARGVCEAVAKAGLEVGSDVSVIGFDDLSWPQEDPVLTTYRLPARELGCVAGEMLVEQIVNGWQPPEKRELDAPLVLRRSAGPLAPSRAAAAEESAHGARSRRKKRSSAAGCVNTRLAETLRSVRMDQNEARRIHEASLELLADPGVRFDHDGICDLLIRAGAQAGADSHVIRIPEPMVAEALEKAPAEVVLADRRGGRTVLTATGSSSIWSTPGMHLQRGDAHRPFTSTDMAGHARVLDQLESVDVVFGMALDDVPPPARDVAGLNVIARNTSKHIRALCFSPQGAEGHGRDGPGG